MVCRDSVNPGRRVAIPTVAAGGNGAVPRTGQAAAADGEDLVILERVEGGAKVATSTLIEEPGSAGPLLNPGANDFQPRISGTVHLRAPPVAEPSEGTVGVTAQGRARHL